jgi:cytidine deaminase
MIALRELPSDTVVKAAQREANKSKERFKHGAVIFTGARRILSKGFNVHKTDPSFGSGNYTLLHAEGAAIKEAIRKGIELAGTSIFVYRLKGSPSKPCPGCQNLIEKYGIKKVLHT